MINNLVRFRQPDGHNCAVYALANVLEDENLLKYCGTGDHEPRNVNDQSNILRAAGKEYHIECLWRDITKNVLPSNFDVYPCESHQSLPLMVVVSDFDDNIRHCIGIHVKYNKDVYVMDSLNNEIAIIRWDNIHSHYPLIHGVYVFVSNYHDGYIIFNADKSN